jgi:hypothetical protein
VRATPAVAAVPVTTVQGHRLGLFDDDWNILWRGVGICDPGA